MDHIGGAGKGRTGALDMNKTVERDAVGGIESRGLHMVDGTDSAAKLDGNLDGFSSFRFGRALKGRF